MNYRHVAALALLGWFLMIPPRVFHRNGQPIPVRNFPYEVWHSARERAKLPHRVPHDFRRTMARNYRRSGEAEGVIMRIGGWKTRSVFERYNVVNENDLRRAAERVVDSNGAKTGQIIRVEMPRAEEHGA
jgi:integrase